jgi:hemoglobin-like flavoprotein
MYPTAEQRVLVHSSFGKIAMRSRTAELFYNRLFDLDPTLRTLFPDDMSEQYGKLMKTLGTLVASLDFQERVEAPMRHLGQRHLQYGAKKEDYQTVGSALLYAIETMLGDAYTPEVGTAWQTVYDVLADFAIKAAY